MDLDSKNQVLCNDYYPLLEALEIVVDLLVLMNSPTWSFLAGAVQPLLDFVVADSIGLPRYARKAWRPE